MEKVKVTLSPIKYKTVEFNGVKVKIKPFITLEDYKIILNDIKETILYNDKMDVKTYSLDIRVNRDILDICSNIDISDLDVSLLTGSEIIHLLRDNIYNYSRIISDITYEYSNWEFEKIFGIVANNIPNSKDMEKSLETMSKMIEKMPQDKLDTIAKSIVWNKMPSLGSVVVPAEHIAERNK